MGHLIDRIVRAQLGWGRALGKKLQPIAAAVVYPLGPIRSFLNGTWLGHPLHPAVTDLPVGAFVVTFVLDLANQRTAADITLVVGVLGLLAAAVTGVADYADTYGRTRDTTTVHATVMVVALLLYLVSLALRLQSPADRTVPIVISTIGLVFVIFGAYLGGDLVFRLGNVVDRHAWTEPEDDAWLPLDTTEIAEGVPVKVMAGSYPLVVVRTGTTILALHETCAHAGGPLSEGKLIDGCIECPWHGSRFQMADGRVRGGPATFDQPRFEVRPRPGGYEARLVGEAD